MNTLLDNAKSHTKKSKRNMDITEQHMELAIAWAKDEINYAQTLHALFGDRKGTMQAYVMLARSLREAIRLGKLHE